jgi:hypothetical protein
VLKVSRPVALQLWSPIRSIGFWQVREGAPVLMPKTAMHENDFLSPRQYNIRLPWELCSMKSVAVSHAMEDPANEHFRFSVL